MGVWHRHVSAHELSRWRLRAPAAGAHAYELRPLDTLLPDDIGLCFDALLATERSPRRLVLFDSQAYELLVLEYRLYYTFQ